MAADMGIVAAPQHTEGIRSRVDGGGIVYLGIGSAAERRCVESRCAARQYRPDARSDRFFAGRSFSQRAADVPFLRPHGLHAHAAALRYRTLHLYDAVALPRNPRDCVYA